MATKTEPLNVGKIIARGVAAEMARWAEERGLPPVDWKATPRVFEEGLEISGHASLMHNYIGEQVREVVQAYAEAFEVEVVTDPALPTCGVSCSMEDGVDIVKVWGVVDPEEFERVLERFNAGKPVSSDG